MTRPGDLRESVAFDEPAGAPDGFGGTTEGWVEAFQCRAQFVFQSGDEAVQAARLAGRDVFKVRVRSSQATRAVTPAYRMRDVRRVTEWDIKSVDAITDRKWVHIVVEGVQA